MTRKILLSPAQRARFFALPSEGQDLIANYTLAPDDLVLINRRPLQLAPEYMAA
jgi:hypothetical protein